MIKLKIKQLWLIKDKSSDFPSYINDYELMESDSLFLESHGCKDRHEFLFLESNFRKVGNEILFKEIHPIVVNFQLSLSATEEFLSDTRISAIFALEKWCYNLMKKNHHRGDTSITLSTLGGIHL